MSTRITSTRLSSIGPVARRHWALVLAVVLLLAAGAVQLGAARASGDQRPDNLALVDQPATAEVEQAVSAALVRVFSYDWSDPDPTAKAADQTLADGARRQYDLLFDQLTAKAPDQQLVLSAQVQVAAVQTLTDDRATLLVFLDQASQRAGDRESSRSAAQLSVSAQRYDGTWRITGFEAL